MASFKIEGAEILSRKLDRLGVRLGVKTLRSSMMRSVAPTVREMKARIPVGTRIHKTYKGLVVGPGFARRSISRRTRKTHDGLALWIGVRQQAFYVVNFLDLGPITVRSRRVTRKSGRRTDTTKVSAGRTFAARSIKPYTLRKRPWFLSVYVRNQGAITREMSAEMKAQIAKVLRGG